MCALHARECEKLLLNRQFCSNMKILLSAYACEPHRGSEPGVGWNVARELVKHHDVWVITAEDLHRVPIETELAKNPVPGLHFQYFSLPGWARWWKRGTYGFQLDYYLWQIGVYVVARKLHRQVGFDLVQHVTHVKYWNPSFLVLLGVPFIWGPVGGGESAPKTFWQDFSFRGKIFETMRDIARWLGEHDPFVGLTTRRSAAALGTTEETAARLSALGAKHVKVLGQCWLSQEDIELLGSFPPPSDSPVRFISIGRLIHWKGFHLGLRAFARASIEGAEYWIVGDGPERKRMEALVKELGLTERVRFCGALPRSETLAKLKECHVLVHPSLHDSGSWVCLEAMAARRPVVCLDLGGPATQVTEWVGFKVPADTPEQAVHDIAAAMTRLANDPELRRRMGEGARKRVCEVFSQENMGWSLLQFHKQVLGYE